MVPPEKKTVEIPNCFALMLCFGAKDWVLFEYLKEQYNSGRRMLIIIGNEENCTSSNIMKSNANYPGWEILETVSVGENSAVIYLNQ